MRLVGLRWLPLPILVLGVLAAWALARSGPRGEPRESSLAPPRVPVIQARRRDVPLSVRTHGTVEPAREIDLVAEVPGRVRALAAALEPGAFFEAEELLVELERVDAELALERAEAAQLRRESELRLARTQLARLRLLAASEVASAVQIEGAEHAERLAQAGLREARAACRQAQHELARTRIRAPFAGRVRARWVDGGQFVARGTPLARVYAVDFAEVRLPLPMTELANLDLPLGGGLLAKGPRVTLRAAVGGRTVQRSGRLLRVEGEIAPRSRMLYVVARVEDPFGRGVHAGLPALLPGLFVEAEIEGRTLESVFVLPREALRGPDEVLTVDAERRLRAQRVEVLRVETERVLVGRGLEPGDRVAVSAVGAMEGLRVRAVPAESGLDTGELPCVHFCPLAGRMPR